MAVENANDTTEQKAAVAEAPKKEVFKSPDSTTLAEGLTAKGAEMHHLLTLMNSAKLDPSVASDLSGSIKNLAEERVEERKKAAKETTTTEQTIKSPPETKTTEEKKEEPKQEATDDKTEVETKKDTAWNSGNKSKAEFKTLEDVGPYVSEKYSMDIKEPNDYNKFFDSVNKWRTSAQKSAHLETELEGIKSQIKDLPGPLFEAMGAWTTGGNWEDALNKAGARLDFTKDATNHDKNTLVKAYFAKEFERVSTNGELDDEAKAAQINAFHESAVNVYKKDQQNFVTQRADIDEKNRLNQAAFKSSIKASVEKFQEEYGEFKPEELSVVEKVLSDTQSLNSELFDSANNYREDAAKKVAFMLFGHQLYESDVNEATRKAEGEANLKTVSRGMDGPDSKKKGAQMNPGDETATKVANLMGGFFKQSPYDHKEKLE